MSPPPNLTASFAAPPVVSTMPVLFCQTHTVAGDPTSFSVGRGRLNCFIRDGYFVDTGVPRVLSLDERLATGRDLVEILRGWILNGFTPNHPVRNYLRLDIYGFNDRQDLDYIRNHIQSEIYPLDQVFRLEFDVNHWISDDDGLPYMDLRIEIALSDIAEVGLLMRR